MREKRNLDWNNCWRLLWCAILVLAGLTTAADLHADWPDSRRVVPNHLIRTHEFTASAGKSVAVSGDVFGSSGRLLVGAPSKSFNGTNNGVVYAYSRLNVSWLLEPEPLLHAPDFESKAGFGHSVAIAGDGETLVIGAPFSNLAGPVNSGTAYIFTRTDAAPWTLHTILHAADAGQSHSFGISAAISGDGQAVFIGAPGWGLQQGCQACGAVYVFTRDPSTNIWSQQQLLTPWDEGTFKIFGSAVAVAADTLVVGARGDSPPDNLFVNHGAAYVFVNEGGVWTPQQKLSASDKSDGAEFGGAVAISPDSLAVLIGAAGDGETGPGAGAAYVFARPADSANPQPWKEQQKLVEMPPAVPSKAMGSAVAISGAGPGGVAIVGAPIPSDGIGGNSALLFTRSGPDGEWSLTGLFFGNDCPQPTGGFGTSIALSGDIAAIGSMSHQRAHIFDVAAFGACCLPAGCAEMRPSQCVAIGGEFTGIGLSCAEVSCDPPDPTCAADLTGDGSVGVADLLQLLAKWGPCP